MEYIVHFLPIFDRDPLHVTLTCLKAVTLLVLHLQYLWKICKERVCGRTAPRTRAISRHIPSEFCEGPVVRDGLTTRPLVNRILSGGDVPGVRSRDWLLYSHPHRLRFFLRRKTMEFKIWNSSNLNKLIIPLNYFLTNPSGYILLLQYLLYINL